ncbi:18860_t:CDS:2 [Acaulospora morrowiae]|uniref:18860_t:CDS:1 n=1 Tax=Acaulospora morrowiae TaxID=94023 RepID=A0A9N9F3S8_9GLOM|nr:18860_t:CDS:2 [Acaulospora morrowiae]
MEITTTNNNTTSHPAEISPPVEKPIKIIASWEERISTFVNAISQPTTKAGELLTTLLDTFFPNGVTPNYDQSSSDSQKPDIFTQLITLCDTKALADHGVISKALATSQLHEIHQNLQSYCKEGVRSVFMKKLVELCDGFYKLMTDNTRRDAVQLLPIMITFAFLHLAVLRERSTCKTEIFGNTGGVGGWKSPFATELSRQVRDYELYFTEMYLQWKDWRKSKILISTFDDPQDPKTFIQQVLDTITINPNTTSEPRRIRYFSPEEDAQAETGDNKAFITNACTNSKLRLFNETNAEFMKLYVYTFALHKFAPDNWSASTMAPNAKVAAITYGPYGRDTFPNGLHSLEDCEDKSVLCDDEPGVIIGVNINYGEVLHGLRVIYQTDHKRRIRIGTQKGNPKEGEFVTIRGLNEVCNHIIAVDLYYHSHVICGIEFFFSDGNSTGIMGKKHENAEVIKCGSIGGGEFKLTGIRVADVTRESSGKAISHIELKFEHIRVSDDDAAEL